MNGCDHQSRTMEGAAAEGFSLTEPFQCPDQETSHPLVTHPGKSPHHWTASTTTVPDHLHSRHR